MSEESDIMMQMVGRLEGRQVTMLETQAGLSADVRHLVEEFRTFRAELPCKEHFAAIMEATVSRVEIKGRLDRHIEEEQVEVRRSANRRSAVVSFLTVGGFLGFLKVAKELWVWLGRG